jgi:GTPase Era involved in 16S rRNA processing
MRVSLALLSHTNVGKTTLARTLLRRDIGAVMDRAHVTEVAESHVLMGTPEGDELVLWDTPGFGDSVRLLRRLEQSGNPVGWFLSQVWDRLADRPFWCSQQALHAARDSADVLLYVINATEDPASAGYVAPELRILQWLGKPTLVLLNQVGTRSDSIRDSALVRQWREMLDRHAPGLACRLLSFDAFARCWLQEHALLAQIQECLDPQLRGACARLRAAWRARDAQVLQRSAQVIAEQLASTARDEATVAAATLGDKARQWFGQGSSDATPAEARAQRELSERLDAAVRSSTRQLVELHGLTGTAGTELLQAMGREFDTKRAVDADRAGLLGGLVSGALSGLAADLAAGGMTFGAGAVLGGIAGAVGARKLTRLYNAEKGLSGDTVRWSGEFMEARLESALVRYLAVAHFGRGRGDFQMGAAPAAWREAVGAALRAQAGGRANLWQDLRADPGATARLSPVIEGLLAAALRSLYPDAADDFEGSAL